MAKILPTLQKMFSDGKIPMREGVWIDIYNQSVNTEIAGTILTRISSANYYYVTEIKETDTDKHDE